MAKGGKRLGPPMKLWMIAARILAAWIDWLSVRCGPRIGLIGHSLVRSSACMPWRTSRLAVRCVVALSPPRLSYSWFCTSPEGPRFLETYAEAERSVHAGRPAALLDVRCPCHLSSRLPAFWRNMDLMSVTTTFGSYGCAMSRPCDAGQH